MKILAANINIVDKVFTREYYLSKHINFLALRSNCRKQVFKSLGIIEYRIYESEMDRSLS